MDSNKTKCTYSNRTKCRKMFYVNAQWQMPVPYIWHNLPATQKILTNCLQKTKRVMDILADRQDKRAT